MPCYHPITGYKSRTVNSNGKRPIVFNRSQGYVDQAIELPCGRCIGCRLERSRQWATRCMHEASLHKQNCFLTLTYDDDHLPTDLSLDITHFQKFMKRLRESLDHKIRFFHCGEYGEKTHRPHYHALIFGHDFDDKICIRRDEENTLYRSPELEKLWDYGMSSVGAVTFKSAAYVARYVTKKVTGDQAQDHYAGRKPEYCTMSRRPGIGYDWIKKYKADVFPRDYVVVNGKEASPPRYYFDVLAKDDELQANKIKGRRAGQARVQRARNDNSYRRLYDREVCKKAQLDNISRPVD